MTHISKEEIVANWVFYKHSRAGDDSQLADMIRSAIDPAGPNGSTINVTELKTIELALHATAHNELTALNNLLDGIKSGNVDFTAEANEKVASFIEDTTSYIASWKRDEPDYTFSEAMINIGNVFLGLASAVALVGLAVDSTPIFGLATVFGLGGASFFATGTIGELVHFATE